VTPGKIIAKGQGASGTTYRLRFDSGSSGTMSLYVGTGKDSVSMGAVMDARNFDYAVYEADYEMRELIRQAEEEFGYA
jgi:hypothetical protein